MRSPRTDPSAAQPTFSTHEWATIAAVVDVIVPPDAHAGGWSGGVERLLEEHADGFMNWCVEPLKAVVVAVDALALERQGVDLVALQPEGRRGVVDELVAREGAGSPTSPMAMVRREDLKPFDALIRVAFEGYYAGTSEPAGWEVAKFRPIPEGVTPIEPDPLPHITPSALDPHYDVIVIGAGAGGGVAACELAESGLRVLLIERSRNHRSRELRGNHLQGKRDQEYDLIAGPGPDSPRVLETAEGSVRVARSDRSGFDYGLVAMAVGGGTRLWEAMSWRFFPEDFRMKDEYGTPDGSTLANWPIGYDELAPYYDRVEWELGVSGDSRGVLGLRTPRSRAYPMEALPDDRTRVVLSDAARQLGWQPTSLPFAINTEPRHGRAACVRCSQCVGHACPVNAKNGTHNTFIPRAIATGRTDLLTGSQVTKILHDGRGRATSVQVVTETDSGPVASTVRADRVVVSAGALETPRLLLASGLGNAWVGRNHHSHGGAIAIAAESPAGVKSDIGPGHSVGTLDFVHRNHEAWGGGVLFDMLPSYPLARALGVAANPATRYGPSHKAVMSEARIPLGAMSMVQEIPHEATRIVLDPHLRDRNGMPALRVRFTAHSASREAAEYMAVHAQRWVEAAGGRHVMAMSGPGLAQGSEHSAGTVRFGTDPDSAACDERGLLFGTTNVYVADASLHPTNGGFNPGLTVMANSLRIARLIAHG